MPRIFAEKPCYCTLLCHAQIIIIIFAYLTASNKKNEQTNEEKKLLRNHADYHRAYINEYEYTSVFDCCLACVCVFVRVINTHTHSLILIFLPCDNLKTLYESCIIIILASFSFFSSVSSSKIYRLSFAFPPFEPLYLLNKSKNKQK